MAYVMPSCQNMSIRHALWPWAAKDNTQGIVDRFNLDLGVYLVIK